MGSNWTLSEAREGLARLVDAAGRGEPQRVRLDDRNEVVVMSARDYDLMAQRPKTFVEHLMSFPKAPEGVDDDIFDDRDRYRSTARDIDFGD